MTGEGNLGLGRYPRTRMRRNRRDDWNRRLVAENRLGVVDRWQVPHHGGYGAIRAELAVALQPTVAVVNNGPRKGGTPDSLEVVQATSEVGGVWQSHRTMTDDAAAHQTEEALIANLTEEDDCAGHWIKATVQPDGRTWTITNGRTGYSRNYQSK